MLGDELLDVIHRYPDHVWVFLHEFPALTGERAAQFRERRRAYERRVEAVLQAGVESGEFRDLRPEADGHGLARDAQLHLPLAEGRRASCRLGTWRSRSPTSSCGGSPTRAPSRPRSGLTAPSTRRRRRSPNRSSSARRRPPDTSRHRRGRSADPSPSGWRPAMASSASGGSSSWMRRAERPRAHAVDADPVACVLDRRDLGQLDDRRLGGAVGRGVRPRREAGDRRRQHDRARLLRAHDRHRGPDAVDGPQDVDAEGALPVLGREVVDAAVRGEHAGVADQHVEAAEALDGERRPRTRPGRSRSRRRAPSRPAPSAGREAGDGRVERRCAHVAQHEVGGGLARELLGQRRAERAARTGDGDDPSPPASYEQVAAVDVEHGAGDERRGVGGQELVAAGQVGRRPPAALRGVPGDGGRQLGVARPRLGQRRLEPPRGDDVDRDAGGGQVEGETLGQADQAGLRRAVGG